MHYLCLLMHVNVCYLTIHVHVDYKYIIISCRNTCTWLLDVDVQYAEWSPFNDDDLVC